jgi:hypothetical protein
LLTMVISSSIHFPVNDTVLFLWLNNTLWYIYVWYICTYMYEYVCVCVYIYIHMYVYI